LLVELGDCDRELLNDLSYVRKVLIESADLVGAHVIGESFHKFSPQGVTGILSISESHLSVHTWPEYAYAAVDIFTCSDMDANKAADYIIQCFHSLDSSRIEVPRGIIKSPVRIS
jgi:S-adenosylmethionine decarboxylase proenzyme